MTAEIRWYSEMDDALAAGRRSDKPILLIFFNPWNADCPRMDTVTYPESRVSQFIRKNFIPLRIRSDSKPYPRKFYIISTPTLIILGPTEMQHHRTTGFFCPEELIHSLVLGLAKYHFDHSRFDKALVHLEQLEKRPQRQHPENRFPRQSPPPQANLRPQAVESCRQETEYEFPQQHMG